MYACLPCNHWLCLSLSRYIYTLYLDRPIYRSTRLFYSPEVRLCDSVATAPTSWSRSLLNALHSNRHHPAVAIFPGTVFHVVSLLQGLLLLAVLIYFSNKVYTSCQHFSTHNLSTAAEAKNNKSSRGQGVIEATSKPPAIVCESKMGPASGPAWLNL